MRNDTALAEVNIHLRARAEDKNIIDQAVGLIGTNRSQFMLATALKEAKTILSDQTTLHLQSQAFNAVLQWMDDEPNTAEAEGMRRLRNAKPLW
jgi:uncharacterized protein (DUF1778 family)